MEQTKQKLKILDSNTDYPFLLIIFIDDMSDAVSIASQKYEYSDEFLRNFFIKFGMKKTLDSFQ